MLLRQNETAFFYSCACEIFPSRLYWRLKIVLSRFDSLAIVHIFFSVSHFYFFHFCSTQRSSNFVSSQQTHRVRVTATHTKVLHELNFIHIISCYCIALFLSAYKFFLLLHFRNESAVYSVPHIILLQM